MKMRDRRRALRKKSRKKGGRGDPHTQTDRQIDRRMDGGENGFTPIRVKSPLVGFVLHSGDV